MGFLCPGLLSGPMADTCLTQTITTKCVSQILTPWVMIWGIEQFVCRYIFSATPDFFPISFFQKPFSLLGGGKKKGKKCVNAFIKFACFSGSL